MGNAFKLRLLDQYWISGSRDLEGEPEDTTSHGKILLAIDGEDVSGCDDKSTGYGINQSSVALLQSVFVDHIPRTQPPDNSMASWFWYDSPMFYHGCMIPETCPTCIIDFRARHLDNDEVELDQFYVTGGPRDSDPKRFQEKHVLLSNKNYAQDIFIFAREALAFLPPSKGDDAERPSYEALRAEHEALLSLVGQYLEEGSVTDGMRTRALGFDVARCGRRVEGD